MKKSRCTEEKIIATLREAEAGAKVPGTDCHATTTIPCVAEPNKPMSQCDAGVKCTEGGETVHVTTPDGGSRVITFRDGKVSATDADAPVKTPRRVDSRFQYFCNQLPVTAVP